MLHARLLGGKIQINNWLYMALNFHQEKLKFSNKKKLFQTNYSSLNLKAFFVYIFNH